MKKIAVVGSINMDLTAQADRHPRKGETVSGRDLQYVPGGKGANQAVAAARLGGDVTMFGCVGEDMFADRLIDNLTENGVYTGFIRRVPGISSGIAMITVAEGDNTIVVIPGANQCVTKEYVREMKEEILKADIILLQNEIPADAVRETAEIAYEAGKTVIYNPAPAAPLPDAMLDMISFLTPNEHETAILFPDETDLDSLLAKMGGKLIVTLGEQGAAAFTDGRIIRIPARPAHVADTTGAGDTFNGALAYALACGYPLEKALRFANTAASLSAEKVGAQGGMPELGDVIKADNSEEK